MERDAALLGHYPQKNVDQVEMKEGVTENEVKQDRTNILSTRSMCNKTCLLTNTTHQYN